MRKTMLSLLGFALGFGLLFAGCRSDKPATALRKAPANEYASTVRSAADRSGEFSAEMAGRIDLPATVPLDVFEFDAAEVAACPGQDWRDILGERFHRLSRRRVEPQVSEAEVLVASAFAKPEPEVDAGSDEEPVAAPRGILGPELELAPEASEFSFDGPAIEPEPVAHPVSETWDDGVWVESIFADARPSRRSELSSF